MNGWAVVIPDGRYEAERLVHHDSLELTGLDGLDRPALGAEVLVVRDGTEPIVVALGRVDPATGAVDRDPDDPQSDEEVASLVVTYTRRAFDEPVPADRLTFAGPVFPVEETLYRELASRIGPPSDRRTWLVSLDLPIEAPTPAEAVRLFWSYVLELGPRELPAFVSPAGNELAMQAFVLGAEANLDPEEDDED